MSSDDHSPQIARLLITLDSADTSESCVRAVSGLLARDGLDITGLYVEDEDLLRAARLPGLREISLSGREEILEAGRIMSDKASEAKMARQAFEALTESLTQAQLRIRHRFVVARGRMIDELDHAANQSDVVMVTRTLRAAGLRSREGRVFASLIRQPRHVLFVNEPWASGSSVVVLDSNTQALEYAQELARAEDLRLLARLCQSEDARLLVLPGLTEVDWAGLLVSLMDRLPCSVLKLAPAALQAPGGAGGSNPDRRSDQRPEA